jgi:hypothetical protein
MDPVMRALVIAAACGTLLASAPDARETSREVMEVGKLLSSPRLPSTLQ